MHFQRIQQTVSSLVTDYLLDVQPGLAVVLQQTADSIVDRFVHGPRGVHAHQDNNGDWFWPVQDGLGSVRSMADDLLAVQGAQHYAPYGQPFGALGSLGLPFGFTGEQTDEDDLVFLRARYLSPELGAFLSLDPFEGMAGRPMSLNGYSWVEGSTPNATDPSGQIYEQPSAWGTCLSTGINAPCPSAVDYMPPVKTFKDLDPLSFAQHVAGFVDENNNIFGDTFRGESTVSAAMLAAAARALADFAERAGNDDAARNIRHFLDNTGTPMNDYPVEKMLFELVDFRGDVRDTLDSTVWAFIHNRTDLRQSLGENCSLWSQHTAWQFVGNGLGVEAHRQIYNRMLSGDLSQWFFSGPASGVARNEYDWHIAMNKFHYAIAQSIVVNESTGEAQVCYRIDLTDYYAWYVNPETGDLDARMAFIDAFGSGQNYEINGQSAIRCEKFNIRDAVADDRAGATHPHYQFQGP